MSTQSIQVLAEDPSVPLPTGCDPKYVGCHCCPANLFWRQCFVISETEVITWNQKYKTTTKLKDLNGLFI